MAPTCTTIDHCCPLNHPDGTPCYCGARRWNQDSPFYAGPKGSTEPATKLPRVGSVVRIGEANHEVLRIDRKEGMFQTNDGRWHEPTEIQR